MPVGLHPAAIVPLTALLTLGACTELPDRAGELAPCAEISQADYENQRGSSASWRTVDLTGGGYHSQASGQRSQRCWPRVQQMNSPDRRCVQKNDLVVAMQTDGATTYYRVPARTTYMLYGEAGEARCRVVMKDN